MAAPPEHPADAQEVEIVNFRALSNWLRFAAASVRRHKWVAIGTASILVALAVLALAVLPKKYQVQCSLLAQKNQVLAVAGDNQGNEGPTRGATEIIMRRENLVNLVRETKLVEEWPKRRAPIQRLRDWVMSLVSDPPTTDQRVDALVGYLQQQLKVWTDHGTVTIQIVWPDPQMAYRLVDAAQRNFLEARHVQEITTIAESASILEGHAADLRADIDSALEDIRSLRNRRREQATASAEDKDNGKDKDKDKPKPLPPRPAAPSTSSDSSTARHLSELRVLIDAKQKALDQLEAFRRQRISKLQAKLEEQRAVYTDAHPAVADTKQALEAASQESPQARQLKGDLTRLQSDYDALHSKATEEAAAEGKDRKRLAPFASAGRLPNDALRIEQEVADDRDPEMELARSKLRYAVENYQSLQDRLQKTRIDLDTAEAAFKYRYTVVTPPEVPHGPISPKTKLVLGGALVGGIVLGLLAAFGVDLKRGTLYERWQVEQALHLPVLTNIQLPPHQPDKPT